VVISDFGSYSETGFFCQSISLLSVLVVAFWSSVRSDSAPMSKGRDHREIASAGAVRASERRRGEAEPIRAPVSGKSTGECDAFALENDARDRSGPGLCTRGRAGGSYSYCRHSVLAV
jgi:hypothetical protein